MSESSITIFFLTLSGGFQDAYTYVMRGGVFANAQTGNIVLFATNMLSKEWSKALGYLIPILAFSFGIFLAEMLRTLLYQHLVLYKWKASENSKESLLHPQCVSETYAPEQSIFINTYIQKTKRISYRFCIISL